MIFFLYIFTHNFTGYYVFLFHFIHAPRTFNKWYLCHAVDDITVYLNISLFDYCISTSWFSILQYFLLYFSVFKLYTKTNKPWFNRFNLTFTSLPVLMTSSTIAPTYRTEDSGISACLVDNKYIIFLLKTRLQRTRACTHPNVILCWDICSSQTGHKAVFYPPQRPIFAMTVGANVS